MSLIEKILNWQAPSPQASAWTNPAWWSGGGEAISGVSVDPDTALKISTVFACVSLISETIASLPLVMYRYLNNEAGRERARTHPLYSVLHDQPNENQTAFEFIQMMQTHALLRGSGYAEIKSGSRGFADQLIPLRPDQVQKEKILSTGRVRYKVTNDDNSVRILTADQMFEVGGLSLDGWNTLSVVDYARNSFGLSLAAENYGSRFFRNDTRPGGVLQTEGRLSNDAAKRLKASWESSHSGGNQHRVAILEEGLKWQPVSITPEEAQFLQTREFSAEEIAGRWFRVPPHMVGLTSKTTSWGTGIEEMNIGFLTYTLRPWLTRWVQAIKRDLILAPQTYFADFVVEDLLKGDIASRYSAYATGRQWGWLSTNEIRQYENLNPVPGGDAYLTPMNMTTAEVDQPPVKALIPAHYQHLAEESAARLVRKEIAALGKIKDKPQPFSAMADFYDTHAALVAQAMRISQAMALAYCDIGRSEISENGFEAMADWDTRRVRLLAKMAIQKD